MQIKKTIMRANEICFFFWFYYLKTCYFSTQYSYL